MPDSGEAQVLAAISLFAGLSDEQLETLSGRMWRRSIAAGTEVLSSGQNSDTVYILLEGTVKVFRRRANVGDVILAICGAGEVLGEVSLLDGLGHSASVTTLETSQFLLVERAFFIECLHTMPLLTLNLARNAMRRLRLATGQIQALARQDVYSRVACQLLAFADQYSRPVATHPAGSHSNPADAIEIPLRLTQSDLADLIGASRVSVNQALSTYRKSHIIAIDHNHRITVLDRAALMHRCE